MAGRPNKYLPFIAALSEEDIYSPATILSNGEECGLFSLYLRLSGDREEILRRKIRHTLQRFSCNHHFPDADGPVTHRLKFQAPAFGWRGNRWKVAAKLISGQTTAKSCGAIKLEYIAKNQHPNALLERNGLFTLTDVAHVLNLDPNSLTTFAKALAKSHLSPWVHTGFVPAIDGQWLINMSSFAPFFMKCRENYKRRPARWTEFDYLELLDIYPLAGNEKLPNKLNIQTIEEMEPDDRKKFGVWKTRHIEGFLVQKPVLARSAP